MDIDFNSHGDNNIFKKYLFNFKNNRYDGLILQVDHSYFNLHGDLTKNKFVHASFNDPGTYLSVSDHLGNLFIIDFEKEKYWQLLNMGLITFISFLPLKNLECVIGLDSSLIHFCNIETGKINGTLKGHSIPATEISYTDDGYYCLTSCHTEAIVWDISSGSQIHILSLKAEASLKKVVFMPITNHILACFQDDSMNVWQFGTFECIKQIIPEHWSTHHVRAIALSKNGRSMVIGGCNPTLVIFCLDSWVTKKVIEFPENISGTRQLEFVSQVFDGGANKILAILTTSLDVFFFDIETSNFLAGLHQIFGMTEKIAINSTGRYAATIFTTGEINIYAVDKILSGSDFHKENFNSPAVSKVESNVISHNLSPYSKRTQRSSLSFDDVKKELQEVLSLKKLKPILKQFGEYPESYRILIWKTILQLPSNQEAFISLTMKQCHSSYANLDLKYPLTNKSLHNSLKKLLSNLSHWCPLFGEVDFLPEFVFPFVKLCHSDPLSCFEIVATIIVNWCQNWFEFYPFPPVNILSTLENVLGYHDPDLLEFYIRNNITSSISICPLFHTAFSEVLSKKEWLKLWDHIISNEPSFLFMAILAYNVVCRNAIKSLKCAKEIEKFFRRQNPIDMKMLISKTYFFLNKTPEDIHSRQFFGPFKPFSSGGTYVSFIAYPKLIVDSNIEKLNSIRKEEKNILEEQMKALSIKDKLEKKLKRDNKADEHERMYKELEDRIRKTVEEEEDRIVAQRQKLRNLKQEIRLKELEVLENARDEALKKKAKRKEFELERLIKDISKKRALEKVEVDVMEEEIRKYYSDLLLKKCQLELELVASDSENEVGKNLEIHRDKLKKDLCDNEYTSLKKNKKLDIGSKIVTIKKLINDLEIDLAREEVKNQSKSPHIVLDNIKAKVQDLENHTQNFLMENMNRMQGKKERQSVNEQFSGKLKFERAHPPSPHISSNFRTRNRIKKSENNRYKKTVKITTRKIIPGVKRSIKKSTTVRSSQKENDKNKFTKKEEKKNLSKLLQKSNRPKTKSKLTCLAECSGKKPSFFIKPSINGLDDNTESLFSQGEEILEEKKHNNTSPESCDCGETIEKYRIRRKHLSGDYSFGSDSENEIFKSALRTRRQLIKNAKIRQDLQ